MFVLEVFMKLRAYLAFVIAMTIFAIVISCVLFPFALITSLRKHSAPLVMRLIVNWVDHLFRIVCAIMRIKSDFRLAHLGTIPPCVVIPSPINIWT